MAKSKTMTLYQYEVTYLSMKDGATRTTGKVLSIYTEPERVIKSVQSDAMKESKTAILAKKVDERKVTVDLEKAWNDAKPATPATTPQK